MERIPIMRKDVKLAFAVGAVLISVLIVYVLLVPGGKPTDRQAVNLDPGNGAGNTAKSETTPAPETNTNLVSNAKPAEAAPKTEVAPNEQTAAAPTTKPTDPFASAEDKWMLALNRGAVPMMTSAPDIASPRVVGNHTAAPAPTMSGSGTITLPKPAEPTATTTQPG